VTLRENLENLSNSNEDKWRTNDLKWIKNAASWSDWESGFDKLEEKVGVLESLAPYLHQVSISSMFYEQLLCAKIPNVQKQTVKSSVCFCAFKIYGLKSCT
jgi:hypothetical protein